MDKKFIMGHDDWLARSSSTTANPTYISPGLRVNLMKIAIKVACKFYSSFFEKSILHFDYNKLVHEYEQTLSHAVSLGLFKEGGGREKDHLNLWCLDRVLSPEVYVESGVFVGGSLHAFIKSPSLKKTIAIDPNIHMLKIPKDKIPGVELINDKDFSQITFDLHGMDAIVYFDDHINTADRILQASKKGFKYILFDDSTGLEGICQRLYPAIPTVPMITNYEILNIGDKLSWSFNMPSKMGLKNMLKEMLGMEVNNRITHVSLTVTQALIDECFKANELIKKCRKIPCLGEFIPQAYPERMVDTGKFIIELK